jgi:hypothetical protein
MNPLEVVRWAVTKAVQKHRTVPAEAPPAVVAAVDSIDK